MAEHCNNCGAELFAGQQFCRRCGAATRKFSTAEIPTQILPGQQPPEQPATGAQEAQPPYTTPLAGRETDSVYPSRFAQYHQPPAAAAATSHAALRRESAPPAQRRRRAWRWWLVAAVGLVACFGVGAVLIAQLVSRHLMRKAVIVHNNGSRIVVPDMPPVPNLPNVPAVPGFEAPELDNAEPLDEEGAEVSGDKTVVTKSFPLKSGASFALAQLAGDVTVEGWDGAAAEVRITKRGGSSRDRSELEILHEADDKRLGFKTGAAGGVKEVEYEIRLPRAVRRIEIAAQNGDITLSNLGANVSVNVVRGNISVAGLTGAVSTRTMKGDTRIELKGLTPTGSQVYNAVKGDIELSVGGANVVLKAETVSGSIKSDDELGLSIERQIPGEHAAGTLGKGGQSLVVKTVSGNVKVKD